MYVMLCIISTITGFILVHIIKKDKEEKKLFFQNDMDWKKEQSKFIADVVFHTSEGIYKNTGWKGFSSNPGSIYNYRMTAKMVAGREIERSYSRGYFEDDNGVTYPACIITKAYVEVREVD